METLGQKQEKFTRCLALLILEAFRLGYTARLGEAGRSDEQAEINAIGGIGRERLASLVRPIFPFLADCILNNGKNSGIRFSVHQLGLAADVKLFKGGVYLTLSDDYRALGEFWEKLDPDCRWGGRFLDKLGRPAPDGNHFSLEHNGVK